MKEHDFQEDDVLFDMDDLLSSPPQEQPSSEESNPLPDADTLDFLPDEFDIGFDDQITDDAVDTGAMDDAFTAAVDSLGALSDALDDVSAFSDVPLYDAQFPAEEGDDINTAEEPVFEEEFPANDAPSLYSDADYSEPEVPEISEDSTDVPQPDAAEPDEPMAPAEERVRRERPIRKGRPRRRKGSGLFGIPQMLAAVIWLLIILAIGVTLGRVIWVCAADVLAFGKENKEVTISITSDDTIDTIAKKLQNAGLIRYPNLFKIYADLSDAEEDITTGTFTLNTIYDYMALVNHMSPQSSNRVVIEDVLIPEGYSCRQIFNLLEEKGICKAADLEAYAASGELDDYWFLEGVERGDKYCLEGFLFPDTYDFYENSSPRLALEKMLDGFNYRFTQELYNQLPTLNARLTEMMRKNGFDDTFIAENQMDLRSVLTVASLIEEETANNAESYKIASVIYNRLFNWGNNPRYLNIDAAIFYALGEHKEALTAEDLQIESPYNTYTHTGLVPGPISNPGLASIQAALNPEDTSYYYYVLDPEEGAHLFNKTYEAHEKDRIDIYGG